MGWASQVIATLQGGKTAVFRPRGNSMTPKVQSGELCTVEPLKDDPVPGDVVMCKVHGMEYLHFVKAVRDGEFQIGNAHGKINGWTSRKNVFGKLVKVEP